MLGRGSGCFGASKVGLLHGGLWYWQRQQLGCSLGQGCRANVGVSENLSHLSQSKASREQGLLHVVADFLEACASKRAGAARW